MSTRLRTLALAAVASVILALPCSASAAVFYGGAGIDIWNGTPNPDLAYGAANNDQLFGWDGDDRLYGDIGNDQLYGGMQTDFLSGGAGNDILHSDEADMAADALDCGPGWDTVYYHGEDHVDNCEVLNLVP